MPKRKLRHAQRKRTSKRAPRRIVRATAHFIMNPPPLTAAIQALRESAERYGPSITGKGDARDEAAWKALSGASGAVGRAWAELKKHLHRVGQSFTLVDVSSFDARLSAWLVDCERFVQLTPKQEYRFSEVDRRGREVEKAAHEMELRLAGACKEKEDGPEDNPRDPIPLTWLRRQVPAKKVRGDASKLALWLKRRGVRVFKIAGRNYAERAELLREFKARSRTHEFIKEYADDEN